MTRPVMTWLCFCGAEVSIQYGYCLACCRTRPPALADTPLGAVAAVPERQSPMARLRGVLRVLGYVLSDDGSARWHHPFGPSIEDENLGRASGATAIPNEAALVRWIYEGGLEQGAKHVRGQLRQALGLR